MITAETEKSIKRGLAYLASIQSRDGSWRTNYSSGTYPTAMTALAGLALLSSGSTPVEGPYASNIRRATNFLLSRANKDGLISFNYEEGSRPMYGHGFAMLYLAEAYGMERNPTRQKQIHNVLVRAVHLTGKAQSKLGGWYYTSNPGHDEGSVTITQIQALRACRNAGIKVPKSVIEGGAKYIELSANADGGIRYQAGRGGGSARPAITAAAVATLYSAGKYDNPVAKKSLEWPKARYLNSGGTISYGGHQYYMILYMSQAMYLSGEDNWKKFFPGTRDWLVSAQLQDGGWQGDHVGTTYGTAIALLTLNLAYGNLPIFQR